MSSLLGFSVAARVSLYGIRDPGTRVLAASPVHQTPCLFTPEFQCLGRIMCSTDACWRNDQEREEGDEWKYQLFHGYLGLSVLCTFFM